MPDPHAFQVDDEIAEIENRSGNRKLFAVLGGFMLLLLAAIIVIGSGERKRLAEIAARPKTVPVQLGSYIGTVGNQALFDHNGTLAYVQLAGDSDVSGGAQFVRPLDYDGTGAPIPLEEGTSHWALTSADSLPYVIEPIINPLTGFNVDDYRQLPLGAMTPDDYRSGGPRDWFSLQMEGTPVAISGTLRDLEGAIYMVADSTRVRLQGIEGLSSVDSLEVRWAIGGGGGMSAFGRISSTPSRREDAALFVMTLTAVQPTIAN
jgi:hypothetical protein